MKWGIFKKKEEVQIAPESSYAVMAQIPDYVIQEMEKRGNSVYVLWWEQTVQPAHIISVKAELKVHGIDVVTISGIKKPEVYKLVRQNGSTVELGKTGL